MYNGLKERRLHKDLLANCQFQSFPNFRTVTFSSHFLELSYFVTIIYYYYLYLYLLLLKVYFSLAVYM